MYKYIHLMLSLIFISPSNFYEKVLSDFSIHSYYVYLKIELNGKDEEVIIENQNLYNYLNKTEGIDEQQYKKKLLTILKTHKKLIIKSTHNNTDFLEISQNNREVDKIAKQGKEYFINYYFNQFKGLKDNIPENNKRSIIKTLFLWKILCRVNDESGLLSYYK
ncbi:MAG: hypothetical protein ACM3RX_05710 [Methanococcaceae archaeon]